MTFFGVLYFEDRKETLGPSPSLVESWQPDMGSICLPSVAFRKIHGSFEDKLG
jgi:hypothetical protein